MKQVIIPNFLWLVNVFPPGFPVVFAYYKEKAPASEDAGAFFFVFYGREGSSATTVSTLAVPGNISTATARTAS